MFNKILLIGDMVSGCKVALTAMEPVLMHKKHQAFCLPTEIVSNTFGYRKVAQVSTGDYVAETIEAWQQLDFRFDAVYVGYITDRKQAAAVAEYCRLLKEKGVKIFHDPVMGENCHLYYGMGDDVAQLHRDILPLTDYTFPSMTEAAYLTGRDYTRPDITREEIYAIMDDLVLMGAKNIAITSCVVDGKTVVALYDDRTGEKLLYPYERIPVKIGGTGDVFSAFVIADVMNGMEFSPAVQWTVGRLITLIRMDMNKEDKLRGLNLEKLLGEI